MILETDGGGTLMEVLVCFFYLCLIARAVIGAVPDNPLLKQILREKTLEDVECQAAIRASRDVDKFTKVDHVPKLKGHWVSQGCELWNGFNRIRSIKFSGNGLFKYLSYYYRDTSCSEPLITLKETGVAFLYSDNKPLSISDEFEYFNIPVNTTMSVVLNVTGKFYNSLVNESDADNIWRNNSCYYPPHKKWKRLKEFQLVLKDDCGYYKPLDLRLLRTQTTLTEGRRTKQLLTVSQPAFVSFSDDRGLFNPPLYLAGQRHICPSCHAIVKASIHSPPKVKPKPHIPSLLTGKWVSMQCEPLRKDLYLSRTAQFKPDEWTWKIEHDYFTDELCTKAGYSTVAEGIYEKDDYEDVTFLNLTVTKAHLTVKSDENPVIQKALKSKVHSPCEFSSLCPNHTIHIIMKMELDRQMSPLLYLGEISTAGERSLSFSLPLMQCSI